MSISQRTVNLYKRSQNYTVSPFESSKTKTEKETLDDLEMMKNILEGLLDF